MDYMFDDDLWLKAYNMAEKEIKHLPVLINTSRRGFRGKAPIVYCKIVVKGNKQSIDELKSMDWYGQHNENDNGKRVLHMAKTFLKLEECSK